MNRTKRLALINLIVLLALINWNYVSNSGIVGGETVGTISRKYDNLFTPASYAFAIWGFIYLSLLFQAIYYIAAAFKTSQDIDYILKSAPWLIISNLGNALWLWCWLHEYLGVSVILMIFIFFSLLIAVVRLNMERWNAPVMYIATVWWPIDVYVGWISIALIANVTVYLKYIGFNGAFLSEEVWALVVIIFATFIHFWMVWQRNMREFAAVGIWAFVAIGVRHWTLLPLIVWTAFICSALLIIFNLFHAWYHRDTIPLIGKNSKWRS